MALGVQRLLPLMQQIYFNFVNIVSKKSAIDDYLKIFFSQQLEYLNTNEKNKIHLLNKIVFKNVSLNFTNRIVFKNMNLEIKKGSNIGVIGQTGKGKTTFINLLTGLMQPDNGKILIDDRDLNKKNIHSWASEITYVPQEIFYLIAQ